MAPIRGLVIYIEDLKMSEPVILKKINSNGVAEITLNRPNVFNGYNEELLTSLEKTLDELEDNNGVRVVILRGAGKHF